MSHINSENTNTSLAGVVQWIECRPVNQSAAGSISSQSTCLGCGPGPQVHVRGNHTLMFLSLSLPPSLSNNKEIKKKVKIQIQIKNILQKVD